MDKRMQQKKKFLRILLGMLLVFLLIDGVIIGRWLYQNYFGMKAEPVSMSLGGSSTLSVEPSELIPKSVRLMAVGDNIGHTGVFQAGMQSDGTNDYSVLYNNISEYLDACDLKIINQETILGGDEKGFSTYPNFNTPQAIGTAMVNAGFNVIQHASNHSLDMGQSGLLNCVDFWKTNHPDTLVLGIYETAEEQAQIPILEVNGIKFALLNYTYSHNASSFSRYAEGHLNMLCAYDADTRAIDFNTIHPKVLTDIAQAEILADFTIVLPHWGTEYTTTPTNQEINFAKQMTAAGADLIIGAHPHVIQPVEWVEAENGNRALCYYSLGNYTSVQDGVAQMLGGMANLTIIKDSTGTYIDEESIKAIPLVTHYVYPTPTGYCIVEGTYLLNDYTEEMAANHGIRRAFSKTLTKEKLLSLATEVFGEYLSME